MRLREVVHSDLSGSTKANRRNRLSRLHSIVPTHTGHSQRGTTLTPVPVPKIANRAFHSDAHIPGRRRTAAVTHYQICTVTTAPIIIDIHASRYTTGTAT